MLLQNSIVEFTYTRGLFGSSILEEVSFLLLLLVQDLETSDSEALSPVKRCVWSVVCMAF